MHQDGRVRGQCDLHTAGRGVQCSLSTVRLSQWILSLFLSIQWWVVDEVLGGFDGVVCGARRSNQWAAQLDPRGAQCDHLYNLSVIYNTILCFKLIASSLLVVVVGQGDGGGAAEVLSGFLLGRLLIA